MSEGNQDKLIRSFKAHGDAVNAVRFTLDGNFCVTACSDRSVRLCNPHKSDFDNSEEAFMIKSYVGNHGYEVRDIAIFHDNSKIVSVGGDK
jgi:mitogen-activated protein kinase organizer 1